MTGFLVSRLGPEHRMRATRSRLPSALGASSFARLATALAGAPPVALTPAPVPAGEDVIRVAHPAELDAEFARVAAGAYQHRRAHSIWELRPADDGPGYVLVRKREERLTDLRASRSAGAQTQHGVLTVNLMVPVTTDIALGMLRGPGHSGANEADAEEYHLEPMERDPFEADTSEVERELVDDPEGHVASIHRQLRLASLLKAAVSIEDALHKWVTAERSFLPELMGGRYVVRGMDWPASRYRKLRAPSDGPTFYVNGFHLPGETDQLYGVPHPGLPYPSARPEHQDLNMRIRLFPMGGGEPVYVTLRELDTRFRLGRDQSIPEHRRTGPLDEVPEMPGDAIEHLGDDTLPDVGGAGFAETSLYPTEYKTVARRLQYNPHDGQTPRHAGRPPAPLAGSLVRDLDALVRRAADARRPDHDAPDPDRSHGGVPRGRPAPGAGLGRGGRAPGDAPRAPGRDRARVPRG